MENLFLHYMNQRRQLEESLTKPEPGPVITISREYGCYGSEIASLLAEKINQTISDQNKHWVFISHQVLHDAASALDVTPNEISHIFGAEEKSIIDEMFSVFSKDRYLTDNQIKRVLAQIVRSYAEQGRTIIVGRAGCVVAKHIQRAIHVRLMAPFCWRVNQIKIRFGISTQEATAKVKETDKRRETFMKFYRGDKPESELFDLVFNRSTMATHEIVDIIYHFAKQRGMF